MLNPFYLSLGESQSLYGVQEGQGPDLILLHGALTTHRDWFGAPIAALSRDFRVTAIDRPGHGESRRRRFDGTAREQAAQIAQGLDALGIDRFDLVGHSMGGLVALALAERLGTRVRSLVLLAPLAFPELRPLEHLLLAPRSLPFWGPWLSTVAAASIDKPRLKAVKRLMFWPQPVPDDWSWLHGEDHVRAADAMIGEGEETAAVLPGSPAALINCLQITMPTTIVQGARDKIVDPNRHARPLSRLLPNARLVELRGTGHMVHRVALPDVLQAISETASRAHNAVR